MNIQTVPTLEDVVTQIANLARGVALNDSSFPNVRALNDTPVTLNQGDCPQLFFVPNLDSAPNQLAFSPSDGFVPKGRHDYEVLCIYADTAENLDTIWDSRPRVAAFVSNFVEALRTHNDLLGLVDNLNVMTNGAQDGLNFNGGKFRGAYLRVKAMLFV